MNLKKSYYLSERIYETMNCEEKQSEARKKYWRNLLGETMFDQMYKVNIPVRQHRKSGRRETVCPGLRKPLMRVYSRNVLSKP